MRILHLALGGVLAGSLVLGSAAAAKAQSGQVCGGSVSLLILNSAALVNRFAASASDVAIVRRDASTVIFADGRVVTSDPAAAGEHLNTLGWSDRRIEMVASFPKTRRPRRARG